MKTNPIKKKISILTRNQRPQWDREDMNQRIHISEWAIEVEAIMVLGDLDFLQVLYPLLC